MMEILIYTIILLVSYHVANQKYRKKINIVFLFTAIWCLFGSISAIGLYGLRQPDIIIHCYSWIFICIVNAIVLFGAGIRPTFSLPILNVNKNRVIIVQLVTIILVFPSLLRSIEVLLSTGSLAQVRIEYFSNGLSYGNIIIDLLFSAVPSGLLIALIVYYIYVAFNRRQLIYVLYSFLNASITFFLNGGRTTLFVMFGVLLVTFCYSNSKTINSRKYLKRIRIVIAYILVAFVALTILRGSDSFVVSTVEYFSGSLSFLDYILDNPNEYGLHDGYLYGYMILGFITEPVVLLLKVLGLTDAKIPSYYFNVCCQEFVDISASSFSTPIYFNNNTSVLFFFIRDMGTMGVILGSIFYGIIISVSYKRFVKGNHFWGLIHIFLCFTLLYSIMGYYLKGYSLIFTFIAFRYLVQKQ